MSAPSGASAQINRLAHLLGVPVSEVAGLDGVPAEELRNLHRQISDAMFGPGRPRFARIAALSERLPASASGRLAERFLPPVLAAQVSVELEPAKARELVNRVSLDYLAELSAALDPSRCAEVVRALPPQRVGQIAGALFARHEYAALAEFAGVIDADGLRAALDAGGADDLLALVPLLEWTGDLAQVVAEIDDAKIDDILHAIVDGDRWAEAGVLTDSVPEEVRRRLVARAGDHQEMLAQLEQAVERGDLVGSAADLVHAAAASQG